MHKYEVTPKVGFTLGMHAGCMRTYAGCIRAYAACIQAAYVRMQPAYARNAGCIRA